ncbi:DUF952 domain-containing protein [Aridibaculum aurantiacum]|uniref:DUF952 domain-containing protein n=1 Tax=Aridibaculum aurantiacum TaxID=2810307 RepID=UPI001A97CCCB|nr:DUF952 domain-containing protein [Aridibaculum aurantiacum]
MDAPVIYHLTTLPEWEEAQDKGVYDPPSFQKDGFIHCCTDEQLDHVMKRHFEQHENLIKLVIDPARVTQPLRYEHNESYNQEYPHIYGPLNLEAVTQVVFLDPITSED